MSREGLIVLIIVLLIVIGFIALCMIPTSMAKKRGRSQFGWFLFSFLFSPILGMIFLACLGETDQKRQEKIWEEEQWRKMMRD
ncbi:MAG: hypothetical protein Q4G63_12285 [Bacteroidia bacterium]|nr:hypothetical protein [Bacteroidia bacterium]